MHAEYLNAHHILTICIRLDILSSEVSQEVSGCGTYGFQQPSIDLIGDLILYVRSNYTVEVIDEEVEVIFYGCMICQNSFCFFDLHIT